MLLRPCPFCEKKIPRAITVCPYCHRDEQGQMVQMDTSASATVESAQALERDMQDLGSEDSYLRDQAMVRMAHRGHGVVQGLIAVLGDLGKPGLAGVAKALGRIGDRRAIPALAQAARMGDEDVRLAAVWALSQIHDPDVLPALIAEADRKDPTVQSYLAYVLGTFRDSTILPTLERLGRHSHREVAFHAACAMGDLGDARAVPSLRRLYRKSDDLLRAAAAASLRRLGVSAKRPRQLTVGGIVAAVLLLGVAAGWWWLRQ